MARSCVDRHALLFEVFTAMDADKSGFVDQDEFKSIFTDGGAKYSEERLAEIDRTRGRGDKDGRLSRDEFCEYFMEYFADDIEDVFLETRALWMECIAASRRKLMLRRVFSSMDVDKSGFVSLEEFKQLGDEQVGAANSEAYFRWIESFQGNGDGRLTSEEWVPFVLQQEEESSEDEFDSKVRDWQAVLARKRRLTLLHSVYTKMDADASDHVDLSEFATLEDADAADAESRGQLEMIFHYLDGRGDADGSLSREEWIAGMMEMADHTNDSEFEDEIAKWVRAIAINQRRTWRRRFASEHARDLVSAARASGATHVVLVRHGNASATRELSNQGTAQCMVARQEYFGRLPARRPLLVSPVAAARQTALQMAEGVADDAPADDARAVGGLAKVHVIEELHASMSAPKCERVLHQRACGPLRSFLDADGGEVAFGEYAEAACAALCGAVRARERGRDEEREKAAAHTPSYERASYLGVFGEAVLLAAVGHALACAAGASADALEALLDFEPREAEAILVPLYPGGAGVQHLKRPL